MGPIKILTPNNLTSIEFLTDSVLLVFIKICQIRFVAKRHLPERRGRGGPDSKINEGGNIFVVLISLRTERVRERAATASAGEKNGSGSCPILR